MSDELVITNVYRFSNGMVMVFDQHGQQMPEFQGQFQEMIDKIRAVYDGPIVDAIWSWR
jgi:hypothetical protein